jgi:hypothetical protein
MHSPIHLVSLTLVTLQNIVVLSIAVLEVLNCYETCTINGCGNNTIMELLFYDMCNNVLGRIRYLWSVRILWITINIVEHWFM